MHLFSAIKVTMPDKKASSSSVLNAATAVISATVIANLAGPLAAAVAYNLTTAVLQKQGQRFTDTKIGAQLAKLGVLQPAHKQRIKKTLAETYKYYFEKHPNYCFVGIEMLFQDEAIVQLIADRLVQLEPIDDEFVHEKIEQHFQEHDPMHLILVGEPGLKPERVLPDFVACYKEVLRRHADEGEIAILLHMVDSTTELKGHIDNATATLVDHMSDKHHKSTEAMKSHIDEAMAKMQTKATQPPILPSPQPPTTNPFFISGRITDRTHFFGRQKELRETQNDLNSYQSVAVYGPSQIGKSSFLYHLYMTRRQWLTTEARIEYFDLQKVTDEADFCRRILQRLGKKKGNLNKLRDVLEDSNLILLLDEGERLKQSSFSVEVQNVLRSVAQEPTVALCFGLQQRVSVAFPSSGMALSPFHNIFLHCELKPFSEAECYDLLESRLATCPIDFTPTEKRRLVTDSGGHPAQLQRGAYRLFREKQA